ncbi:7441_t:CDS:2 [Cetraspora pellucida]|uniref:7441_t:CDS:1 n=1 Tax=Cetraspora pellucida TaxID=1433469 RepID=A0A9N9HI65_9GLOM|nr:7441_t:CDS:2 [Cetraspora pellucida]
MINNIARKQTHIGKLLGEKLALQLIYRRCKAKVDLAEFNRAWVFNRYQKWKTREINSHQNILILNQQILALYNNQQNRRNMAGIPQPFFDWSDDIPDFLVKLRLYLQNQGVNLADNAGDPPTGREVAIGYLRGSNLLDNTGQANIVAVNGYTAIQIEANRINEALNQPGNAIVKLRAIEAGGRPTNNAPNAPNANVGNTVVVPGIRFDQAIWWLKTHFPTVEEKLQNMISEELRRKFLDALSLPWLKKAEDINEHLLLDELAKKLYEIELRQIARHKKDKIPNLLQGISLEDMQKAIQNALAQQKTEYQSLLEKQKADYQSQMSQAPAPQIVEPVRQPRGPSSSLQSEEGFKNYYVAEYLKELKKAINEDRDAVNQLTNQFQKVYICKCVICGETGYSKDSCPNRQIARSNFNRSAYFKPLTPINFQNTPPDSDNEEEGYDEENNRWTSFHHRYKKCACPERLWRRSQKNQMSGFHLYSTSIIDEPSDFAIKGNSKHITDSLEWYTDVPVTMKDKEGKTVTVIRNFVHIDNGKPKPMLILGMSNIQKLQGVFEPNKNQFCIKLYRKTYIIPTYSKALVAKEPSKEEQN